MVDYKRIIDTRKVLLRELLEKATLREKLNNRIRQIRKELDGLDNYILQEDDKTIN